jgi:polyisoprenoid-binding protein YceI
MRPYLILGALVGALSLPGLARAQTYSFDVHPKLINITFESRMDVEDILGSSRKVTGYVKRSAAGRYSFALKVPVSSLRTGIALRDKHLRSPMWLDAARHPHIEFKGNRVKYLGKGRYRVRGTLTLHGVSRPKTVVLRVRKIPASVAARAGLGKGNWLRVRGKLQVKLSSHGVKIPEMAAAKVNDRWTVKVSLFAKHKR